MIYISPNGEYPRYQGDIQLENPDWTPGDELPIGWNLVQDSPTPEVAEDETFFELPPVEIDGIFIRQWSTRKLTEQEIENKNAYSNAVKKLEAAGLNEQEIYQMLKRAMGLGL